MIEQPELLASDADEQPKIRRAPLAGQICPPPPRRPFLYVPPDIAAANVNHGAMCGHVALAAALGVPTMQALAFFADFRRDRAWVNIPDMEAAMNAAGARFRSTRSEWPRAGTEPGRRRGLVIVQFTGPWLDDGVPPAAACRYTHWVAAREGYVFDINDDGWQPYDRWAKNLPRLYREMSAKADGWRVKRGYEVDPAR